MMPQNNLNFWNIAHLAKMYFSLQTLLKAQLTLLGDVNETYPLSNHIFVTIGEPYFVANGDT